MLAHLKKGENSAFAEIDVFSQSSTPHSNLQNVPISSSGKHKLAWSLHIQNIFLCMLMCVVLCHVYHNSKKRIEKKKKPAIVKMYESGQYLSQMFCLALTATTGSIHDFVTQSSA